MMRDLAILLIILGSLPYVLKRPWIGCLIFIWISLMSPHKFTYGFAYFFPFAAIVAIATLVGMLMANKKIILPINSIVVILILLPFWMTVTYIFSLEPEAGFDRWVEVMKIFFFVLVTASLINSRVQLEWLIWVIVISVGFYGIKGGVFTILTGGSSRVYGPPGSGFISDNNAISVALVMVIPLMHYLQLIASSRWIRLGLTGAILLSGMAILGTHSRGAFLAALCMVLFLWFKSERKFGFALFLAVLLPVAISFMPEEWMDRMQTIQTYDQDASAMGRVNAWHMAFNVANARPLIGGGFELYTLKTFAIYAPVPEDLHSAHSIYFQMLGEHGYVGLALFLALLITTWSMSRKIIAASRDRPDHVWAANLARAVQVSLIGFAAGGAFVNIGYWELPYYEIVALMVAYRLVSLAIKNSRSIDARSGIPPDLSSNHRS